MPAKVWLCPSCDERRMWPDDNWPGVGRWYRADSCRIGRWVGWVRSVARVSRAPDLKSRKCTRSWRKGSGSWAPTWSLAPESQDRPSIPRRSTSGFSSTSRVYEATTPSWAQCVVSSGYSGRSTGFIGFYTRMGYFGPVRVYDEDDPGQPADARGATRRRPGDKAAAK